jgi:hypothetical protein
MQGSAAVGKRLSVSGNVYAAMANFEQIPWRPLQFDDFGSGIGARGGQMKRGAFQWRALEFFRRGFDDDDRT